MQIYAEFAASRIYLKQHRLGPLAERKQRSNNMRMWRNGRRAGFRFQWRDSCGFKSRHPHQQKRYSPCGCAFFVYKDGGFEIGRKLRSNLSAGPNSPVDWLSAKAATGGTPVIRTKNPRKKFRGFFIQVADLVYHHALACISSAPVGLYLITRQRAFPCGLMIYKTSFDDIPQ